MQDEYKGEYYIDGQMTFLVTYINFNSKGTRYERHVYGLLELVSKVGGLFIGLNKAFALVVLLMCELKFKSKLIAIINFRQVDKDGKASGSGE